MIIQEEKLITIRDAGKTLSFTVPLNTEVTKDYIKEKINNPKLTACEEWLKKKGFVKEERGWSYYGDTYGVNKKTITIPISFIDKKTRSLYVKFHRIENVKAVIFPFLDHRIGDFSTLNNFPDHIDKSSKITIRSVSEIERRFYIEVSKTSEMVKYSLLTIDDYLLYYIAKDDLKTPTGFLISERFDSDKIKEYDPALSDLLKSLIGVGKFNL